MVLSNQVRDIIAKQSEINSIHNEYKSLIPGNDIPDMKRIYHNNMLKISEKTINLKSPKSTKEEIKVKKDGVKEDVDKEFTFDEIIEIPEEQFKEVEKDTDALTFFDDELSSDDEDKEPEDPELSKDKGISPEEVKEDKEDISTEEEEVNLLNMIDNKLLLDMLSEKKGDNKKGNNKKDSDITKVEATKESSDIKKIVMNEEDSVSLDKSNGSKTIKLNGKYEFY